MYVQNYKLLHNCIPYCARALIYFVHPLDPALIQGNTVTVKFRETKCIIGE